MPATSPGALPQIPLAIAGSDTAQQEYFDELRKVLDALQSRQGINLWNVAGQLFDPGRTGQFGEALGRVSKAVGEDIEKERQAQLPIAKLRAELAAQKYSAAQEGDALRMLGGAVGADPALLKREMESGSLPSGIAGKFSPELYSAVAARSPRVGEIFKNAANMETERQKMVIDLIGKGLTAADLIGKFGSGITKYFPAGFAAPAAAGPAAAGPAAPAAATPTPPTTPISTVSPQVTPPPVEAAPVESLGTQQEILKERAKQRDKEFEPARAAILEITPQVLAQSDRELKELLTIADRHPEIFGLLQKQGVYSGLLNAAQAGVNTPWGSVNLPVKEFIQNLAVPEELRPDLTRATQILGRQFLVNAKANKGAVGPQVSNFDVQLMQAPMATPQDTAQTIVYWTKLNLLGNKERDATYNAFLDYERKAGAGAPLAGFFGPNSPYKKIVEDYNNYYQQLVQNHSPTYTRATTPPPVRSQDAIDRTGDWLRRIITPGVR